MSEPKNKKSINRAIKKNQSRYIATHQFLKEKKLNKVPCFLVIGPQNTGKTTLLKNAELNFVLEKKFLKNKVIPSLTYSWWVTKEATYIDAPGCFFDDNKKLAQRSRTHFLRFLKNHCHEKNLSGIILTVGLDKLFSLNNEQKLEKLLQNIEENLREIYKTFQNRPPIYLAINKCDLMTGFREFFGELSRDERQQYWGISFQSNTDIVKSFSENFDSLMKRLSQQLIFRLQHEYNPDKKALINDFPLQMKHTKSKLIDFFKKWQDALEKKFNLSDVFFTAATQQSKSNLTISHSKSNDTQLINIQQPTTHAYFVNDFFQRHIMHKLNTLYKKHHFGKSKFALKLIAALVMVGLILGFATLWTYNFKKQVTFINNTQQAITTYRVLSEEKSPNKKDFTKRLNSLKHLQNASLAFNKKVQYLPNALSPNKALTQLKHQSIFVYNNALQKFMIPKITKTLTHLLSDKKTPANIQYASLESYIMLSQPKHYKASTLNNLLHKVWKYIYPNTDNSATFSYLDDLLGKEAIKINPNEKLIKTAQNRLLQLNSMQLAYIIFQNSVPKNQPLSLNLNNNASAATVLTLADPNININSIYTSDGYKAVNPGIIQSAAFEAIRGNWVLGNVQNTRNTKSTSVKILTEKLKTKYLDDYANTWLAFLNNIKIVNFTQLDQLNHALTLLSSDNSLLLQLSNLIKNNLVMEAFSDNEQLSNLAYIVQNNSTSDNSFQAVVSTLKQLNTEINALATSEQPSKAAFKFAAYRMRNNGGDDAIEKLFSMSSVYPEPIKSWLNSIASNAWQIILFQTQEYINSQWKKNIMPQYDAQLANRFPFQITASRNSTLESFSYFFKPNGLLDDFFMSYLQPFIDTTQQPWKLKNVDGDGLQISSSILANLEAIYTIQHTYFRNNDQHIYVPFSIQPNKLSVNIISMNLKLGQQSFTFNNETPYQKNAFVWPDAFNTNLCQVTIADIKDQTTIIPCTGPWGLFKLLKKAHLAATKKPNTYLATINQGDYTAEINLTTARKTNPFSLGLLSHFRLPETIG